MGVAAFDTDGKFLCSQLLKANSKDPAAKRLLTIRQKYEQWITITFGDVYITTTIIEHLPPSQLTASLPISAGAIVSSVRNMSRLTPECSIGTQAWKSVAKQLGCTMRDPKGTIMFKQIPWEFKIPPTEDEADATMMYLAYTFNQKGFAWLGPTLRVKRILE